MAIENEVLRSEGKIRKKKRSRLESLENHITVLGTSKTEKSTLEGEIAAFDAIIAGIVSEAKRDAINGSAAVIRLQADYVTLISNADARVVGERGSISKVNDFVQADGDYNATEKQEFADAKTNEV